MIDTLSIAERLKEAGFSEVQAAALTRAIERYATDHISLVEERMNTELARGTQALADAIKRSDEQFKLSNEEFKRRDEQFKRSDERFAEITAQSNARFEQINRLSDAKFETGQANMKAEIEKAIRTQTV